MFGVVSFGERLRLCVPVGGGWRWGADPFSFAADAVWHAGDRHERLAEEHHLPALHQEQQADPVVLAGGSGQESWQGHYSSPPETRD